MTTFVDSHCHLFNFVDIPVYETLDGKVSMNTAVKLLGAMSASGALLSGFAQKKIHDYKDFVQFFERSQKENIRTLAYEMNKYLPEELKVVIPLVMDFDCVRQTCGQECKPCIDERCSLFLVPDPSIAQDPSSSEQLDRLTHSIESMTKSLASADGKMVKLFPFIGFDLRKLTPQNSTALSELKILWQKVGVTLAERQQGFAKIPNGKVLGIKLYPPIGFNPYPGEPTALAAYKEFYEWCIAEHIPITVHCQAGSYSAGRKKRDVNNDTHARNWCRLFEDWDSGKIQSSQDIKELRINFAHFGGEDGLEDMLDGWRVDGIDEKSWTYAIVDLLTKYPHTYSDLSAFDWSDKEAVKNLRDLLEMDKNSRFGGQRYAVARKLLWGSDIPMILDSKAYYRNTDRDNEQGYRYLVENYRKAVGKNHIVGDQGENIITHMTATAPAEFLLS